MSAPALTALPEESIRFRWLGLAAICLGVMTVFFNITATFTVLEPLQTAEQVSSTELVWVTSAYSLVIGSLVLTAGTVGDLVGRKTIFLIGLIIVVGANLLIVFSASAVGAITGQAIMGLGAALMLPTSLAIVSHTFVDARERTQAIGFWAASTGIGTAVGPLVAGGVLKSADWNTVYVVPAIAAAAVVFIARKFVSNSRNPGRRLDILGALLATLTITALIYAVIQGGRDGFSDGKILGSFAAAAAALIAFIIVESRVRAPMMELTLFRSPSYATIMIVGVGSLFMVNALGLLLLFLFQRAQSLSPSDAGVRILPLYIAFITLSTVGSRIVHLIGVKLTIAAGLALVAAGSALMLTVGAATSYTSIWPILVVLGAGLGLILATTTSAAMLSVRRENAGMASASVNMFRQIGGVLGASVIGTVLTSNFASTLPGQLAAHDVPSAIARAIVSSGASVSGELAASGAFGSAVTDAIKDSLMSAIHVSFVITLIVAVAVAIPTLLFIHTRPAPPTDI